MHDVHLGLVGKLIVDFLLVLIEFLLLGVTAEFQSSTFGEN